MSGSSRTRCILPSLTHRRNGRVPRKMKLRISATLAAILFFAVTTLFAQTDDANKQLARDIFKQLIEINTTDSTGSTTVAAEAMAQRLRDAGFPASDAQVLGPNSRKGNLVARLRGTGAQRPILLIGHLDVVEARREEWSVDPFQFLERDGYFYGRGTQDMKSADAIFVATLIRLRKENYQPDRDIILALTADEETGASNGVEWLLRNHRDLVDAEFVLNPDGGGVYTRKGKPAMMSVDATEKLYADYQLEVKNPGGHSSLPVSDNAIYHLSDGIARIERYQFPFELNGITRAYFREMATIESGQVAADMKAITKNSPDAAAIARLDLDPLSHATMRTTCVATRVDAGHANNALPQTARAIVNCRILPGHTAEEVRLNLIQVTGRSENHRALRKRRGRNFGDGPRPTVGRAGCASSRSNEPARENREGDVARRSRDTHDGHRRIRRSVHQRRRHADLRNLRPRGRFRRCARAWPRRAYTRGFIFRRLGFLLPLPESPHVAPMKFRLKRAAMNRIP